MGRNWAPTAFSLRDDVSCRHRSNRQPPHCNSCFLTVGSLSAFASINANRVAAKHTYERGISRRRREYAEIACAQRSHLYEILDRGASGSHRQRLAHLHVSLGLPADCLLHELRIFAGCSHAEERSNQARRWCPLRAPGSLLLVAKRVLDRKCHLELL